jgi:hypothetical protein
VMGNLRRLQRRQRLQASRRRAVRGVVVATFKAHLCERCEGQSETHCHAFRAAGMSLCLPCHELLHVIEGGRRGGAGVAARLG